MGLFYKVTSRKLLDVKNEIFVKSGIPALKRNGFEKAPFPETLFGKNNLGDYTYDLCRLTRNSDLEIIVAHIAKGDSWIQIYLNIFNLKPSVESIEQLKGVNGIQFRLNPNNLTRMRLRSDDVKGLPLFNSVEYKVKSFYTESGFQRRVDELSNLIEDDLSNIDSFIKRWHELHRPLVTNWEGKKID
jgi:hypothetical protein